MTLIISVIAILVLALVIYLVTAREERVQVVEEVEEVTEELPQFPLPPIIVEREDFCNGVLCCPGDKHAACNETEKFQASCPKRASQVRAYRLKPLILKEHNKRRSQLATGRLERYASAARMMQMEWDDDLAYIAGFNVRKCAGSYDKCRTTSDYRQAGQSIATDWSQNRYAVLKTAVPKLVETWWSQHAAGDPTKMQQSFQTGPSSRFATMSIDRSGHVGCAVSRYRADEWYKTYIVCNYARKDANDMMIYEAGAKCSKCPEGTTCSTEYDGLCVAGPVNV